MKGHRVRALGILVLASALVAISPLVHPPGINADESLDRDADITVVLCIGADLHVAPDSESAIIVHAAPGDVISWWSPFGRELGLEWVKVFWVPGRLVGWLALNDFRSSVSADREVMPGEQPSCAWQ